MVIIESISLLIRPITLAIRLAANIVAGHIILSLVCLISYNNILTLVLTISTECALIILEIFVAFIQPYVFFILFSLYREELPL
jgi:F-type H+-transporting ATPase subunit a